jgi:hypothetical protein
VCFLCSLASDLLKLLHYFPRKDIQLSVFLFANLGNLEGARVIAANNRSLRGRCVSRRKFHNYAGRSAAQMQHRAS